MPKILSSLSISLLVGCISFLSMESSYAEAYLCKDKDGSTKIQGIPCPSGASTKSPKEIGRKPNYPISPIIVSGCEKIANAAFSAAKLRDSGVSLEAVIQPNIPDHSINGAKAYAFAKKELTPAQLKESILYDCKTPSGMSYMANIQSYYVDTLPKRRITYTSSNRQVFREGKALFKADDPNEYVGNVAAIEQEHSFPDGTQEPGILINRFGNSFWVKTSFANRLYVSK